MHRCTTVYHFFLHFKVLSEARHYLTNVCHAAEVEDNLDDLYNGEPAEKSKLIGHIFAPVRFEAGYQHF